MGKENSGYLLILAAIGLWSTIEVVTKYIHGAHGDVDPMSIAFVRFFLGALLLIPYAIFKTRSEKGHSPDLHSVLRLLPSSFLGITLTFTLYHLALESVKASTSATIIAAVPLFSLPLSSIFLKERLSRRVAFAVLLGLLGVFLLSFEELGAPGSMWGIVYLLGALVSFSTFMVLNKNAGREIGPHSATGFSIGLGALMFSPLLLVLGSPFIPELSPWSWVLLLYLGFLATGVGYLLFFTGLDRVQTARGSSLFYLKPVFAFVLAVLILGEPVMLMSILGIVVVVFSVRMALT